jgi:hypothetical protein
VLDGGCAWVDVAALACCHHQLFIVRDEMVNCSTKCPLQERREGSYKEGEECEVEKLK